MTATRDPDRLLEAFLADGVTTLPERVYLEMRAEIHKVGQEGPTGRQWRGFDRSSRRTWLAAAAAVAVIGVVGATLLPRALVDRSDPAATAIAPASLAPPSSPQPSASPASEAVGPGPVTLEVDGVQVTLTLPEGWHVDPYRVAVDGGPIYDPASPPMVDPREAPTVELWTVETIWRQPCINRYDYGRANTSTARELARQISEAGSFETSGLRQVDVGGHSGWAMDLTVPQQPADCAGPYAMWAGSDGMQTTSTGDHHEILVIDVAGRMIVVDALDRPESSAADRSALRSIVESIQFARVATESPFEPVVGSMASLEVGGVRATVAVTSSEWSRFAGDMGSAGIFRGQIAEDAPQLRAWTVDAAPADPCQPVRAFGVDAGRSADDLVERFRTSVFLSGEPTAVEVQGYAGWMVELAVPADVEACPDGLRRVLWSGDGRIELALPGEHHRLLILDVAGGRIVVDAQDFASNDIMATSELAEMLESIQVERIAPAPEDLTTTEAGPMTLELDGVRATFTVPARWRQLTDEEASGPPTLAKGRLDSYRAPQVRMWRIDAVTKDPCRQPNLLARPTRGRAAGLANRLEDAVGYDQTTPTDIKVDGYAGKAMELTVPDDLTHCHESGRFILWAGEWAVPGEHHRLILIDVDDVTIVVDAQDLPGQTDEDRAELDAIMDSLSID